MLRDELKDGLYFEKCIETISSLIKNGVEKLESGEVTMKKSPYYSGGLFTMSISRLFCMYSAGYSKEEIREYVPKAINLLVSPYNGWECPPNIDLVIRTGQYFPLNLAGYYSTFKEHAEVWSDYLEKNKEKYEAGRWIRYGKYLD